MTPNVTLGAKWELESVILDSYKQLGIPFSFMHVKSHQDNDGRVDSLMLKAQLNVQVVALPMEALKETPTHAMADLFPTKKCQLIIGGASVA
jgi:hypothetical protein